MMCNRRVLIQELALRVRVRMPGGRSDGRRAEAGSCEGCQGLVLESPASEGRGLPVHQGAAMLHGDRPRAVRFGTDLPRACTIGRRTASIRHHNIVPSFIAPMPILLPQVLQFHDRYVSIDVTQIDGTTGSGDTIPVHIGYRAVIAIK